MANLAQFTGQSTANIIARDLGSYAWPLWISAGISLVSLLCAVGVLLLDHFLRSRYVINDKTGGGTISTGVLKQGALRQFSTTFWIVVLFCVFENAGVQSFVSISTFVWIKLTTIALTLKRHPRSQFAQQRLKKGRVVGGWVSSFYLLLPAALSPFLGIFIDAFGHRVFICMHLSTHCPTAPLIYIRSVYVWCFLPGSDAALEALAQYPYIWHVVNFLSSQVKLI